ncbi:Peptidase C-terminal archaeal/bacterial domain-containing protein [uncultured Gammaproteobacteria bacterium]
MMRKPHLVFAVVLALPLLVVGLSTARAAESNLDTDPAKAATNQPANVQNLALATQLIQYGRVHKDPLAMIVAGQIKKEVGVREEKREKASSEGENDAQAKTDKTNTDSAEQILAEAKTLAQGRNDLIAIIDEIAETVTRGRVGGPAVTYDRVKARGIDKWRLTYRGGQLAEVSVNGDHDTDLDLYVYDEQNNLVCSDTAWGDNTYCRWYPRWNGTFYVKIVNHGRVSNRYVLMTN